MRTKQPTHKLIQDFAGKLSRKEIARNERYDAYFDVKTKEWLEPGCKDLFCEFCSGRPEKAP